MRLLHENNVLAETIISNYDFLSIFSYMTNQIFDNSETTLWQIILAEPAIYTEAFNIFSTNAHINIFDIISVLNPDHGIILLKGLDLYSNWLTLFFTFTPDHTTYTNPISWLNLTLTWDISVSSLLLFVYFILLLWKISLENLHYTKNATTNYTHVVNIYLYTWLLGGIDKTESTEEIISLLILWPWCVLLVFTHMMAPTNHNFMFGFAEWGLPILYGLILLLEHVWAFGSYFLVYLTGTRGRKSLTITLLEDLVALIILLARVLLQAVRGVIVGMFHFICREALLNMTGWWSTSFYSNHAIGTDNSKLAGTFDLLHLISDFSIAAISFVIVTAIMFLQLTFLVVSVWLFCKCWFISWQPNINSHLNIKPNISLTNVKTTTSFHADMPL